MALERFEAMSIPAPVGRQIIRVTEIGEFIRNESCERRFKLEANHREIAKQLPFAEQLFDPLDPVLQEVGRQRETEWELSLKAAGLIDLTNYVSKTGDDRSTPWTTFCQQVASIPIGQSAYGREVQVNGEIGNYEIEGRMDFVL